MKNLENWNYYENQLEKLQDSKEYFKTIQIADSDGNSTKNMSLNLESISKIIEFLKREEERLKNEKLSK